VSQNAAFENIISNGVTIFEEGTVLDRTKKGFDLPESLGAAKVNGPTGDKGQYLWMGTYTVRLDRGLTLPEVQHIGVIGNIGAHEQRCFAYGERVVITWLNKNNIQVPMILEGDTLDFYSKIVTSRGHLLDAGEKIIRSAMAKIPGTDGQYPFSNNQWDNAESTPGTSANHDKIVSLPGAETFYDKFGRLITLSRTPGKEFLTTQGQVDSGQDDVSGLSAVADQDAYYAKIQNDESEPISKEEPFAPKPINLSQYQLKHVTCKIVGDPQTNRTVTRGLLPRFDKWRFVPLVIRKYAVDSDGMPESDTYAVKQDRSNSATDGTSLGYVKTVTDKGDVKEFVPRHQNIRTVSDKLESIGGNYELKLKATDRLKDGSSNPTNMVHQELLKDGTVRLRVNENVQAKTNNFESTITPDGGQTVTAKKDIVIDSDTQIYLGGKAGAQNMVLGTNMKGLFDDLFNALNSWIPTSEFALKTALVTFLANYAQSLVPSGNKYYLSKDQKVA
jgi:hypothetical protein